MEFDARDLVQGLRREVTFAAVWADNDRHVFNDQQVCAFAITARDVPGLCAAFAAHIAEKGFRLHVIRHRR